MKKIISIAVSLPIYFFTVMGVLSFLEKISMVNEKDLLESVFLSLFIGAVILITERALSVKNDGQ